MATKREIFTIPEEIIIELNAFSKESLIPKSKLITKLLKDFFDKQKEIKNGKI